MGKIIELDCNVLGYVGGENRGSMVDLFDVAWDGVCICAINDEK